MGILLPHKQRCAPFPLSKHLGSPSRCHTGTPPPGPEPPNCRLHRKGAPTTTNSRRSIHCSLLTYRRGGYAQKFHNLYSYVSNREEVLARVDGMTCGTRLGAKKLLLGCLYGARYVTRYDKITQGQAIPIEPRRVHEFRAETRDASGDICLSASSLIPPGYGEVTHIRQNQCLARAPNYMGTYAKYTPPFCNVDLLERYLNARCT